MDIVLAALGISLVVGFVFFVLARHWQRVLRQQSWAIRKLTERVRGLEEMADPEFLRRLRESAPTPLEEVFTFSFRANDYFWRATLGLSDTDLQFVRAMGSVPASVKIERWRGHIVARITEVLPESKAAGWQTRSLDVYPEKTSGNIPVVLWELPLGQVNGLAEHPPALRLTLEDNTLELSANLGAGASAASASPAGNGHSGGETGEEKVPFFRVALDPVRLAEFRSHDPLQHAENGNGHAPQPASAGFVPESASWQAFYACEDESQGLEWQLWIRDLRKKAEWDRWRILESPPISVPTQDR
jgi:hypothetical protein